MTPPSLDEIIQHRRHLVDEFNGLIERLDVACQDILDLDPTADLPDIPSKRVFQLEDLKTDFRAENAALLRLVEQIEAHAKQQQEELEALPPAEQQRRHRANLRLLFDAELQRLEARIWQLEHRAGVAERGSQARPLEMTGLKRRDSLQTAAPRGAYRRM